MKPQDTSRPSRARTLAIYTASIASITAAVAAGSLLISGCVPCTDPNGCSSTLVPQIKVTLNAKAGKYTGAQTVTIAAPGAEAIYFSTDGTTPGEANCQVWDGNPIPINDSTVLRVFAKGDGVNYRSKALKGEYRLDTSPYANRSALTNWLALEKAALNAAYCTLDPSCVPPNPIDFLTVDQYLVASCPDGGSVTVDVLAYSMATFTYSGCAGAGVVADGYIDLIADFATGKINGAGNVVVSGAGYTASINDSTVRSYTLSGTEGARQGRYDVNCTGASCATQPVGYYYGASNMLWIDDPAVPNSCTP